MEEFHRKFITLENDCHQPKGKTEEPTSKNIHIILQGYAFRLTTDLDYHPRHNQQVQGPQRNKKRSMVWYTYPTSKYKTAMEQKEYNKCE